MSCNLRLTHLPPTLNIKYIHLKDTDAIFLFLISTNFLDPAVQFPFTCLIAISETEFSLQRWLHIHLPDPNKMLMYFYAQREIIHHFQRIVEPLIRERNLDLGSKSLGNFPNTTQLHDAVSVSQFLHLLDEKLGVNPL